ncbi:hypothetical protein LTR69_008038 [Exophiala sideris]|uniref:F-box domain-containing protein n=1 Tax=Exophiala sideris TaxID=1016849 RepID=A0ABR0J3M7_9EURO|nr:hypothetical protein LTR69_008038 [Exophiala sideris]
MDWVQNLKRTRNGSVYSDPTWFSTTDDRAAKRQKTTPSPTDPRRNHLEVLPAELLQQIFLTSMNGNLIQASPVIAVKLSGQTSFYRAAFLLVFFSHDVDKVFDIHRLHYFIPMLELPLSTWDVRSLTKAVLGSRCCSWERVKSWLSENLKYAITQTLQMGKCDNSWREDMQRFMQGQSDIVRMQGRAWWTKDEQQRDIQLETNMWDIRLEHDSDRYEDEWEQEEEEREEKMQNCAPDFPEDAPFRDVVQMYMGLEGQEMESRPQSLDFFELLEKRAVQATRNAHWLRETLAIEFFFWPENQPYKISPRLYRAAAAAGEKLEYPLVDQRGSYLSALYVLFEIDPLSLPRTDPALLCWAGRARRRVVTYRSVLGDLAMEVVDKREDRGGILRNSDTYRFRALKLEHKYCYDMDVQILRFMKTGSLTVSVDSRAPSFAGPLPWHGERLNPSSTALDDAERMAGFGTDPYDIDIFDDDLDDDGTLGSWLTRAVDEKRALKGPLKFLHEDDYRDVLPRNPMERNEPGNALDSYNPYYRSQDHDDYQATIGGWSFGTRSGPIEDDEDVWSTSEEDYESEDGLSDGLPKHREPANIHYGEEPKLHPLAVTEESMAMDWVVAAPDREHPIPPAIKDTELPEPFFGPPKWFKAPEKPYLQEFPHRKNSRKRKP